MKDKFKECAKKGICSLNCSEYKKSECPGYHSTIVDENGKVLFRIPLIDEYRDNYFKELEECAEEEGYITKQELLKKINEKCEFPSRKLTYYMNLGLIPKGIKTFIPYLKGSVSWFEKKVLLIIPAIERLTKGYDLTLKEVSKYANLIHNFNSEELVNYFLPLEEIKGLNPEECDEYIRYAHKLNQHKFKSILKVYAYAKAGYEYDYRYPSLTVDNKTLISSIKAEISDNRVKKIYVRFLELKPGIKISNNEDLANLPVFKEVIFS